MLKKRPIAVCGGLLLIQLWVTAYMPPAVFWLPAAFSLLVSVLLWKRHPTVARCWMLAALLGVLLFLRVYWVRQSRVSQIQQPTLHLSGQVQRISAKGENCHTGTIWVDQLNGQNAGFSVRCTNLPDCRPGEEISGVFRLEPLPHAATSLQFYAQDVWFCAEYQKDFAIKGPSPKLRSRLLRFRQQASSQIRSGLDRESGGVLSTITTGDWDHLPEYLANDYRSAGLIHVLVISGMHLTLLCSIFVCRNASRLAQVGSALGAAGLALLWTGMSGAGYATCRACIAILFQCAGVLCGLPVDAISSLSLAGMLIAAHNPYAVCSASFQCSFVATLGLLFALQWMERHPTDWPGPIWLGRALNALLEPVYLSAMITLFLTPVLLFHGMRPSLGSMVGMAAVVWLLRPMLLCGLLVGVLGLIFPQSGVLYGLRWIGGSCAHLLNGLVTKLTQCSILEIHLRRLPGMVLSFILMGFLLWCRRRGYALPKCLAAAFLLLGLAWYSSNCFGRDLVKITLLGESDKPAVVVTEGGQALVLYRGGKETAREITHFLDQNSIQTVQQVVDLRLGQPTPCPLQGIRNTTLIGSDGHMPEWEHPLPHVQMIMTMDQQGGLVGLYCGSEMVWLYSGSLEPDPPGRHLDWLIASDGDPGCLQDCKKILTLSDHPWLRERIQGKVYHGGKEAALWLRPQTNGRIGVHL